MEESIYLGILFDFYRELFTEKQQGYFVDYYFNNLSYGEIALNSGVSRNAVFGQLKLIKGELLNYEQKLKLYEKKTKLLELLDGKAKDLVEAIL